MPCPNIANKPCNFLLIKEIMQKEKGSLRYRGLRPLNPTAVSYTTHSGPLTGGNLTLLANSLGTGWQLDARGKILVIEDVGIRGYAIDRDLNHLKQAGAFNGVKAIIFGSFEGGDSFCEKAIETFAKETEVPVFSCNWFGHGPKNKPLPFGCPAWINPLTDKRRSELVIHYDFS